MFRVLFLLLITISTSACAQVHEILVTDTTYIDSYLVGDSSDEYFSFKTNMKLNGHWIVYYDVKKQHKALEATFNKNKLAGAEKRWYAEGKLLSNTECQNDTCLTDYFYRDGVLMRREMEAVNYATGNRNWFYVTEYCESGQLKYSPALIPSSKEPQMITSYYCSGAKKEEYTLVIVDGKHLKIRNYNEWFENGNPKTIGYYEDEITGSREKKTGDWSYYNAEGKLIRQEKYEKGELQETMQY